MGMKYRTGKQDKYLARVEELYISLGKTPEEIAEIVPVHRATICRWIKENSMKKKRKLIEKTSWQLASEVQSAIPTLVEKFKNEPNPGNADALLKVIRTFKSIQKDADIVGHALKTLRQFTLYLREVDPPATEIISNHIDGFIDKLFRENVE